MVPDLITKYLNLLEETQLGLHALKAETDPVKKVNSMVNLVELKERVMIYSEILADLRKLS